ncbi:MAG: helix-turn-helix transcriptional regulator [Myxococcales bacterium]|nr:helix-turn-helix transcriptional regulator [Myxococcales bacterium]
MNIDTEAFRAALGGQIDHVRRETGISQAELARRIDLDPTAVGRILRGTYTVSDHHLAAIAAALDVRPVQLLPDGPSASEFALLDAVRQGDTANALHALAVALDTTVERLAGRPGAALIGPQQFTALGQAMAALVVHIAHAVSTDPNDAVKLARTWLSTPPPA